ncbi:class I SAM-dependent methyltransferase [Halobaculum sp. MBLA0147]|uniref:class I SAM-dependent methyltransferase n=1 Tax=Halobaculum sp. MBLA0147 TaxID=3079934 RepID=UPI00352350AF
MAEHFAETRAHPWPEVVDFVETHGAGGDDPAPAVGRGDTAVGHSGAAVGLDLGCGNGRHAELLAGATDRVVGVDASRALLVTARERAAERGYADSLTTVVGDAGALPLASDRVALVVYVATLHHLPTRAARVASLSEVARVLAPGGRALVSAWSTAHDRFDRTDGFDTEIDWTLPGGETVPRFYHVYDPDEFRADLRASDLAVVSTRVSSGNCYAVVAPADE